ncbi:MAG: hypothetical protein ACJAR3_001492 [Roseivirga sp.]
MGENILWDKVKKTLGANLEIGISNKYYYAQILNSGNCAFFAMENKEPLADFSILKTASLLFIIAVYDGVITQKRWLKVGNLEITDTLEIEPFRFIQDSLDPRNFELYNPNTGDIKEANKEECVG